MEGKRFGAGVLGGLLLALLIVGSTAFNGGLFGSFTAAVPAATQSAVTSSSTLVSTSVTSEATMTGTTLSTMSSILYTVSTGEANQVTSSASSSVSSVSASSSSSSAVTISSVTGATSSQTPAEPWYNFLVSAAGFQPSSGSSQPSPSRLSAIAAQPAVLNGFVLVPLLVAVILGALLYRASGRRRSAESESKLE